MSYSLQNANFSGAGGGVIDLGADCAEVEISTIGTAVQYKFVTQQASLVAGVVTPPTAPVAALMTAAAVPAAIDAIGRLASGGTKTIGAPADELLEGQRLDVVGRFLVLWAEGAGTVTALGKQVEAAS